MRDHAFELHQRRKLELQLRVAPVSRCASVARTGTPRAAPLAPQLGRRLPGEHRTPLRGGRR